MFPKTHYSVELIDFKLCHSRHVKGKLHDIHLTYFVEYTSIYVKSDHLRSAGESKSIHDIGNMAYQISRIVSDIYYFILFFFFQWQKKSGNRKIMVCKMSVMLHI